MNGQEAANRENSLVSQSQHGLDYGCKERSLLDQRRPQSSNSNLVVLISGYGSNLQAILDACTSEALPARVAAVISNKKDAFGLARARHCAFFSSVWPEVE